MHHIVKKRGKTAHLICRNCGWAAPHIGYNDNYTVKVEVFARLIFRAQPGRMGVACFLLRGRQACTCRHTLFAFALDKFCRGVREGFHPAKISTFTALHKYDVDIFVVTSI